MRYRALLGLAISAGQFLIPVYACSQTSARALSSDKYCNLAKEEIDVYRTYLNSETSSNASVVVLMETEGYIKDIDAYNLNLAAQGHGIPPEVRADFATKNKSSCVLRPFNRDPKLQFISKKETSQMFDHGTGKFYRKYGKGAGIVTISRVGFNSDKTLALVHALWSFSGELVLFERKNDKWVIKFRIQTMAT